MRTAQQIADCIGDTIRRIYFRPAMYARPDHLESALWDFHWAWSIVYEEETRFQDLFLAMVRKNDAAGGLFLKYKTEHPESSDEEAQTFVIQEWRALSVVLNVPIDV